MKKATLTGALLAMLVICFSALTAVSASAAEWLCNAKAPAAKECVTLSVNLEEVKLKDMSAGAEVDCPVGSITDEGFVGPGAADETTAVTFAEGGKKCTAPAKAENLKGELGKNACEKVEGVEPIHLPWKTTLETINLKQWDTIKGTGVAGGEPGYATTCTALGIKGVKDSCEGNVAAPVLVAIENLKADEEAPKLPLVDVLFLEKTFEETEKSKTPEAEWGKCSIGGANSALVIGEILLEAQIKGTAVSLEADK